MAAPRAAGATSKLMETRVQETDFHAMYEMRMVTVTLGISGKESIMRSVSLCCHPW